MIDRRTFCKVALLSAAGMRLIPQDEVAAVVSEQLADVDDEQEEESSSAGSVNRFCRECMAWQWTSPFGATCSRCSGELITAFEATNAETATGRSIIFGAIFGYDSTGKWGRLEA